MIDETLDPNTGTPQAEDAAEVVAAPEAAACRSPSAHRTLRRRLRPLNWEIYEGPLDLLLDLIRKQQINIYDIPIAKITQQYLDYIHLMEDLNIDVAGEFVFMAATLIHIKSRLLLPPDPTAPPEEQEDPRTRTGAPAA